LTTLLRRALASATLLIVSVVLSSMALAQSDTSLPNPSPSETSAPGSNTPFIDSLKQKMRESGQKDQGAQRTTESPSPYIDSLKKRMTNSGTSAPTAESPQPFIDQQKSLNPSLANPPPGQDYTEQKKQSLPAKETGGAIAAVNEGHSGLEMKRPGEIKNLFGMKTGTLFSHSATAGAQTEGTPFQTVYGKGYAPDVTFDGERVLLGDEHSLTIGLMAFIGIQYFAGPGVFSVQLTKPDGTNFPLQSQTRFAFVNLPAGIGPSLRLHFLKWFQPYAQFMPSGSIFFESRNDQQQGFHGLAFGYTLTVGMAFMLDWISKDTTWDLYRDYGIKHVYLTAEYSDYATPLSDVNFAFSGLNMGFAFEF
jgi:hypothetical protein